MTNFLQKVVVIGGAGFIGSHIVEQYLAAGWGVSVVDNLSTGTRSNIPESVPFYQLDISDYSALSDLLAEIKPSLINLQAAHISVGESVERPQFNAEQNIICVINVMEVARRIGAKKIVFASTGGAMYGNQPVPYTENLTPTPISPYGISKRSAELYLDYYQYQFGIERAILRYANVYGPRQNAHGESGVIAIFLNLLLAGKQITINGDGTHTRDYVYVADVARANLLASTTIVPQPVHIGTNTTFSTNQVYELVAAAIGSSLEALHGPDRAGEQVASQLEHQLAEQIMGWQPTVSFQEGVTQTARWFQDQYNTIKS